MRDAHRAVAGGLGGDAALAVLAAAVERVVALGIALYLPRHLALADYGHYVFLVSLLGLCQGLPDASLEAVLVARAARERAHAGAIAARGAAVRAAVSAAGAVVALAVLALVAREPGLVSAGAVGAVGLLALAATPFRVLLRAEDRLGRYLALLSAQAVLAVGLLALVVRAGGGLAAVLAATASAAILGIGLGRVLAGPARGVAPAVGRELLGGAWPLAGGTLLLLGAQQLVLVFLLHRHGAAEVGLYGAGQKLVEAAGFLPQALMVSVLPALARAAATPGAAPAVARDAARLLVLVLAPIVVGLVLWAGPVVVALFGAPLAAAAPVLRVLAPTVLLGATGIVLTNLLVALGRQRQLLATTAGSAVLAVALGALLVPPLAGRGAAAALATAMLAGQVALLAMPATRAAAAPVLAGVAPPLGLAAGAAALAWLGGWWP